MKVFTTGAAILLVATITRGECVVVVPEVRPSKQNARATIMVAGQPAARLPIHLEITSFPSGKKSEVQLATDARGAIDLRSLPAGQDCLAAAAEPRLTASICLDVTATRDVAPTEFPLVLTPLPPPEPTLDELVARMSPVDLLLVEGWKWHPHPKLEVHRPSLGKSLLYPEDPHIVAIASDEAIAAPIPLLPLTDASAIADFILDHLGCG